MSVGCAIIYTFPALARLLIPRIWIRQICITRQGAWIFDFLGGWGGRKRAEETSYAWLVDSPTAGWDFQSVLKLFNSCKDLGIYLILQFLSYLACFAQCIMYIEVPSWKWVWGLFVLGQIWFSGWYSEQVDNVWVRAIGRESVWRGKCYGGQGNGPVMALVREVLRPNQGPLLAGWPVRDASLHLVR